MYNKYGGKVRLTFKLELDQLWIGTKGTYILGLYIFLRVVPPNTEVFLQRL